MYCSRDLNFESLSSHELATDAGPSRQYCFDPDTPLNEISDPVRTNFGAHLIKLTKKP